MTGNEGEAAFSAVNENGCYCSTLGKRRDAEFRKVEDDKEDCNRVV